MKLSIIIPIYNVEAYLSGCLDSVLDPGLRDYEIIAVNDGSTDGSARIARDYAARYPDLIRLVEQSNGGLGCARNTGLAHARGDYVLFLDSDDSLAPGALPEILEALERDCDVIVFDFTSVDEQGGVLSETSGSGGPGVFSLADYPRQLLEAPNAWNKLWRRSLFTESGIRFPDRLWFEDVATTPRLYLLDPVSAAGRLHHQGQKPRPEPGDHPGGGQLPGGFPPSGRLQPLSAGAGVYDPVPSAAHRFGTGQPH